ncbi:hypothetical protein GCM10023185_31580 [Hymenobacter saemangeumensis]|uniref:Copper-binding protein MbnP-like domain-containing protein n=1 Tax=Hymenobacter saemangeumensis TaxID=1084522 RepID=A0ABP8IMX7_9BACT
MNLHKLNCFLLLLLAACTATKPEDAPAPEPSTAPLAVTVENLVGTAPLTLDTRTYSSPAGESFTVSTFNYYLSNFKLQRADGSEYVVPESYFLVKEERPGSGRPDGKRFVLPDIPVGEYTGISFLIGVDEERNSAGAQSGALSPSNGMFWSWAQGYIFLMMEGNSPQSGDAATRLLSYHIGGVRTPNTLREVAPALPQGTVIRVRGGRTPALQLRTNLLRLFEGPYPVRFGTDFFAVGGPEANRMASNYSGSTQRSVPGRSSMFTIAGVQE